MLKKISFKQLQDAGVFVVTSMSINLPHALEVSSKTLWMLRCKIVTSIWTNFEDALDATLQQNIHVKQLQDTVHATFQHPYPFQSTSRTLWMLCCNIRLNQLRRRSGMLRSNITSISSSSKTLWMLRCNVHFNITSRVPRSFPKRLSVIFNISMVREVA